ncbi:MAG: HD domain-containing protein [Myxococcales bacterium]|nr:HD domain-containing protein [Myxococcales bacterium]
MTRPDLISIRDPIHGAIGVTPRELGIVETRAFQRLRTIKQLGFADHAFPGATHTRFAHALGAMEMAARMFDAIFEGTALPAPDRARLRQALRLAVLLHDIGHAPLSHATERCMPPLRHLGLAELTGAKLADRQARHEDYTVKLLLDSHLSEALRRTFADDGIDPEDVARLVGGRQLLPERADRFVVGGVDYGPLLGQLVSGELDADRMDYLRRDSYYAGVSYGIFDEQWLLSNLCLHEVDGRAFLALRHRAIFAFEDFLLSRYHMFVSVYYHHTPVGFDTMLSRFIDEEPDVFVLPADSEQYIALDDVSFWMLLRGSRSRWAQRIVHRQPYRRVVELNADEALLELPGVRRALDAEGIDYFIARDEGVLSRYFGAAEKLDPIYIVNSTLGQATRVESYSKLFQRYHQPTRLARLYCQPKQISAARECLRSCIPKQFDLF